jgi:hypothetical protein
MDWSGCLRDGGIAKLTCIPVAFNNIINALFTLAGIAGVFFVVFAGIKFLTSGGDPVRVEQARRTMTYAIIGLVLVLMSFVILRLIGNITSTECINKFNLVDCQ